VLVGLDLDEFPWPHEKINTESLNKA
jgi:hypothetical protein